MYLSVSKPMPVAMPVMIGCTISEATGISGPQLSHAKPKRIFKFEHEPKHPRQISMFTVCASKRHKLVDIGIGHEDGKTWEKNMKTNKKNCPLHWLHRPTSTVIVAHLEHMLPPALWQRHCAGSPPLDAACSLSLLVSKAQRHNFFMGSVQTCSWLRISKDNSWIIPAWTTYLVKSMYLQSLSLKVGFN